MRENDKFTLLIQMGMAVLGALARLLSRNRDALKVGLVIGDLFAAGFTGLLLFWITRDLETQPGWLYAVSGIAGWVGPKVLDKLLVYIEKKTGIDLGGKDEKELDKEQPV